MYCKFNTVKKQKKTPPTKKNQKTKTKLFAVNLQQIFVGKRIGKNPAFMYDTAQTVVYTGHTVILIMTDNKIIRTPVQAIRGN